MRALCGLTLFGLIGRERASRLEITQCFGPSLSLKQRAPTVVNALAQSSDAFLWLGQAPPSSIASTASDLSASTP